MAYQVLARKWRPRRFEDLVGQPHTVQALRNALEQQYLHHAYLFTGTRGVGKTTLARLIAKCLNCEKGISATPCETCSSCQEIDSGRFPDLYEVDAASRTKVEDTRELLENVQYTPTKGRYKVYLIDEVHMLSGHSFNALLKTLEEPPSHVIFLLATTDYQKLPATILSRCLQFHLLPIAPDQIAAHLQTIFKKENIEFETRATELLAKAANGSMRDALSLSDQSIAHGNGKVLAENVKAMLGIIESTLLIDIIDALEAKNANELLSLISTLAKHGVDFSQALAELLVLFHQIAVIQQLPSENNDERLRQLSQRLSSEDVQLFYQVGLIGQRDLPFAPTPRVGFEMTLLRMLAFYPEDLESLTTEKKVSQKPPLPTIKVESTLPPPTLPLKTNQWHELLPKLGLTGAALALGQQCSLKEINDTHCRLILNPKQKPLLQKNHTQRINQALNHYFNKTLSLTIDIGEISAADTPAAIAQNEQRHRQLAAEQAIKGDQHVKRIMQTFDATLIENSIISSEQGSSSN